jgi:hypothetical protein
MDVTKSGVMGLIAGAYVRAPRGADALFHIMRRYVMPVLRHRIPLHRLRGHSADGSPGSMLVAGSGPNLDYLTRRFFDGSPQVEPLGWASPLTLARRLDQLENDDDLILARIARPFAALMDDRYIRAPDLVDLWLEVAEADEVLSRASPSVRRRVRELRRLGLTWSLSSDPADLERFYRDYYVPFAQARFGDLAIIQPQSDLHRRFRFGGLAWIRKDGEAILGQLFEPDGDVLRLLSLGAKDGREEYRSLGAFAATKLFGIEQAQATRRAWLNLGGSMPSLRDGSLMSKRSWGGVLRDRENSHRDFVIRWPAFNRRVARFLDDVPLVIRDGRGLSSLTAISSGSPVDPAAAFRRWRQLAPRGLHRFCVATAHGWQALRAGTAPPPAGSVWLCDPCPSESILASARETISSAG